MSDPLRSATERSRSIYFAAVALCMSALPVCTAFAQGAPPTEVIVDEPFAPLVHEWQAQSGSWSVSDGAFVSSGGGPQDINTIVSYRAPDPQSPPTSKQLP